jgi:hypothetical protein
LQLVRFVVQDDDIALKYLLFWTAWCYFWMLVILINWTAWLAALVMFVQQQEHCAQAICSL